MKKLAALLLLAVFLFPAGFSVSALASGSSTQAEEQTAQSLTKAQQSEIEKIQKEILAKQKELIQKYVEFGTISKEKASQINSHFEKHFEMMKENGFQLPKHPHHKHHHDDKDND